MGDPEPASEPPSEQALAVGLGRGEAAGLLAAYDAYGADLIGYAEFRLAAGDADPHLADEAAAAVLDALLVAAGAVVDLTDPDRMRAWLLALTRNECLRRRSGLSAPPNSEAAELGRRGLGPLDVAALIGFAPAELPGRVPAVESVPAWLRAELVAAAGPDGAERRAELIRQARPFEADGFPVPLDRRRLSARALAWSAAAVVAVALAVLVIVPTGGDAAALPVGPVLVAASPDPATGAPDDPGAPLPTLADTPFTVPPEDEVAAPSVPPRVTEEPADRDSRPATLAITYSEARGRGCGEEWTARLEATPVGAEVTEVRASGAGGTVELRRDGGVWTGELTGLPTDRATTVTVWADGPVRAARATLASRC